MELESLQLPHYRAYPKHIQTSHGCNKRHKLALIYYAPKSNTPFLIFRRSQRLMFVRPHRLPIRGSPRSGRASRVCARERGATVSRCHRRNSTKYQSLIYTEEPSCLTKEYAKHKLEYANDAPAKGLRLVEGRPGRPRHRRGPGDATAQGATGATQTKTQTQTT